MWHEEKLQQIVENQRNGLILPKIALWYLWPLHNMSSLIETNVRQIKNGNLILHLSLPEWWDNQPWSFLSSTKIEWGWLNQRNHRQSLEYRSVPIIAPSSSWYDENKQEWLFLPWNMTKYYDSLLKISEVAWTRPISLRCTYDPFITSHFWFTHLCGISITPLRECIESMNTNSYISSIIAQYHIKSRTIIPAMWHDETLQQFVLEFSKRA